MNDFALPKRSSAEAATNLARRVAAISITQRADIKRATSGSTIDMYPNFESKHDRSTKHQALLARIALDQELDALKRQVYADALWATDSKQNKLKARRLIVSSNQ